MSGGFGSGPSGDDPKRAKLSIWGVQGPPPLWNLIYKVRGKSIPWPGFNTKRTHAPSTPYEHSSPMHSKKIPAMCYETLIMMAKGTPLEAKLNQLLRWNTDATMYANISPNMPGHPDQSKPSSVPMVGVQALFDDEIIKEIHESEVLRYATLFTVYEEAKHRQRPILWPRTLNEFLEYIADFTLPGVKKQLSAASKVFWAACFDLTASFFQCPLTYEVSRNFCFRAENGKCYAFQRMVMGFAPSCEIMETILEVVIAYALRDFPGISHDPFVDNVRFGVPDNNPTYLADAALSFRSACAKANITLNVEPLNAPHQQGIYTGIEYDYAAGTASNTDKTRLKLARARTAILSSTATLDEVFEAFGILFFASSVVDYDLGSHYHSFKFFRRKAALFSQGQLKLSHPTPVWNCIRVELAQWFDALADPLLKAPIRRTNSGYVRLFTDASLSGAGAVLFDAEGLVHTWARKWTPLEASRPIHELEAIAAFEAMVFFQPYLTGNHVDLFVDNTSVIGAAKKGYSPSFHFNSHIRNLLDHIRAHGARVQYVKSAHNPSDCESRRFAEKKPNYVVA